MAGETSLKNEFAFSIVIAIVPSRLLYVKCTRTPKNLIQVKKEKENFVVA